MHKVFLALLAAALPAISALADPPAEQQMARRIGMQLKQSGQLHNYEIDVKYHNGVACLEGKVCSTEQRQAAVRLAQKVNGVSRVECKLDVNNNTKPGADDQLKQASAIEDASPEESQSDSSNGTHARQQHREPASMPSRQAQQQMMSNSNNRTANMAGMRQRNNMPLASREMPSMMPVRQASAMGVNQASCPSCNGGQPMGGAPMGGAPMGGPPMGGESCGPGMGGGAPNGFVPQGGRGPNTDNPSMPGYAWPSYASYPNYAALSYPQQYSPTAWPYIGPFYPYPQVPLAWRKVSLEWDDGWWFLDFSSHNSSH
jgi:hypothetical protein